MKYFSYVIDPITQAMDRGFERFQEFLETIHIKAERYIETRRRKIQGKALPYQRDIDGELARIAQGSECPDESDVLQRHGKIRTQEEIDPIIDDLLEADLSGPYKKP